MKRYKLEMLGVPNARPYWYDSKQALDDQVLFMKSIPVDDGPIKLRITEYTQTKVEIV